MKYGLLRVTAFMSLLMLNIQNHTVPSRNVVASCATGVTFLTGYYLLAPHKPRSWITSTVALGLLSRRLYWRVPQETLLDALKKLLK